MPRTARTISVTHEQLVDRWNTLFDTYRWLDGLSARGECGDVGCCPDAGDQVDWLVLGDVLAVLFLATGSTGVPTLSRDLVR